MKNLANTAPQSAPAHFADRLSLPDLLNKTIETGLFRSRKGPILLLVLTDIDSGEAQTVLWNDAPPPLKAYARRLAVDPLKLIARYGDAAMQPDDRHPSEVPAQAA